MSDFADLFDHAVGTSGHLHKDTIPNVEAKDRMDLIHGVLVPGALERTGGLAGLMDKLPGVESWWNPMVSKSKRESEKASQEALVDAYKSIFTDAPVSGEAATFKKYLQDFMAEINKSIATKYPTLKASQMHNGVLEEGGYAEKAPIYIDRDKWAANKDLIISVLRTEGAMSKKDATKLWSDKSMAMSLVELDPKFPMTSSFGSWNDIPAGARAHLVDYYDTNVLQNLTNYIHAATKRGVLDQFIGGMVTGSDGKQRFDATLHARAAAESVSNEDRAKFNTVLMPALLGTLGARMTPELRSINSWGTVFLNTTLLPLSLTSQFVDVAGMAIRDEHVGRVISTTAKLLLSPKFRKQMVAEAEEAMPSLHRAVSEMMSSGGMGSFSSNAAAVNNMFFRMNQMQRWSEMSRVMAYTLGKQAITRYAKQADPSNKNVAERQRGIDDLAELHLTHAEAKAWVEGGQKMDETFNRALNQWVDGAVIKPNAAIRPAWQSDASKVLLSYLHAYTSYAYETFGKRIAHNMSRRTDASRLMPAALAVSTVLPLVMFGSSMRAMISNAGGGDEEKKKRNLYADFMRSGFLGQAAQTAFDMHEADAHGGSMLASATVLTSVAENLLKTFKYTEKEGVDVDWHKLAGQVTPVASGFKAYKKAMGSDSKS
jgi:hypothetical protein